MGSLNLMPENFKGTLPTTEKIEAELNEQKKVSGSDKVGD